MSRYLTPEQVAEQLQVTPKTVRSMLRSGDVVGIKVGKGWRIHPQDLDRYLDSQRLAVLLERAQRKHPENEWVAGSCLECGTPMPVPSKPRYHWVCSQECKCVYDGKAEAVLGYGSEEYAGCTANVVPHY